MTRRTPRPDEFYPSLGGGGGFLLIQDASPLSQISITKNILQPVAGLLILFVPLMSKSF